MNDQEREELALEIYVAATEGHAVKHWSLLTDDRRERWRRAADAAWRVMNSAGWIGAEPAATEEHARELVAA